MLLLFALACDAPPTRPEVEDRGVADTAVDSELSADSAAPTCWEDRDGDGYGDAGAPSGADDCPPEGYAQNAEDCDDSDASRHPGAEEICEDGVVQDCLGSEADAGGGCAWQGTGTLDDADASWTGVEESGQLGGMLALPGDLDGDGSPELALAAYLADAGERSRGVVYVVDGNTRGAHTASEAEATITGADDDLYVGRALAAMGDVDGDGLPELAIGAPGKGVDENGQTSLFFGGALSGALLSSDADLVVSGTWDGDQAGYSLSRGELDGDGVPDLAIGAPGHDTDARNAGATYVMRGATLDGALDGGDAALTAYGVGLDAQIGESVDLSGDLDGDGLSDLLVRSVEDARVYLIAGERAPGEVWAEPGEADITWDIRRNNAGGDHAMTSVGDFTGDGLDDAAIAAPYAGSGYVWLVAGARGLAGGDLDTVAWTRWDGESGVSLGDAVAPVGDLDSDDRADLALGDSADEGQIYIVYGTDDPGVGLHLQDGPSWLGNTTNNSNGNGLAGGGDADGDGRPDLLIGNIAAGDEAGEAWLLLGPGY